MSLSLAAALLVAASPTGTTAQDAPTVTPGSVATVPVTLQVPRAAAGSARVRVVIADGIHLFGQADRAVEVPAEGELLVPVTFQLAATFPAGVSRVASVEVQWPDGTWSRAGLEIHVAVESRLSLDLGDSSGTVTPGSSVEIPFSIVNEGNATDSVFLNLDASQDWRIETAPQPFVLAPRDTITGVARLRAPRSAATGRMRRVAVVASGARAEVTERVSVYLIQEETWGPTYEKLPTSVFVGAFTAPDTLASLDQVIASVNAFGVVGKDTEIGFRGSRYADRIPPSSFRSLLPPPRFQLMVGRPSWRATVGDTYFDPEPFGTLIRNAQGVSVELDRGPLNGSLLVGRPWSGADRNEGHVVLGDLGVARVGPGRLSALFTDASQTLFAGGMPERSRAIGARYRLASLRGALFEAEAGWTRVTDIHERSGSGPTGAFRGSLQGLRHSLDFGARYVPATLPGITGGSSEAFLGGTRRLGDKTRAVGQARYFHRPLLGSEFSPRTLSGTIGFGLEPMPITDFLATYQYKRALETGALGLDEIEHRIGLDAHLSLGRLSFRLGARRGVATLAGETSATHRLTGAVRYSDRNSVLGLSTWYESGGFRAARIQSQLDAQWTYRALSMAAGLIVSRTEGLGYDDPYGWANVALQLRHDLALVLGAEQNTSTISQGEVLFSLGLRKDFGLPLPVRKRPVVEGEVYTDANNNGRRDPEELGIRDVRLFLGPKEVRTDGEGRFEVHGEAFRGYRLQVDVTSLAADMLMPPSPRLPSEGEVSIPVVETTTGVLIFFLDSNRNGRRDEGEGPAAGARITLTDPVGRVLVHFTDENGVVHLSGLPYGPYAASAVVPQGPRNRETETSFTLDVSRDVRLRREIGVDDGARTILFRPKPGADSIPPVPVRPVFDFLSPAERAVEDPPGDGAGESDAGGSGAPFPRPHQDEDRTPPTAEGQPRTDDGTEGEKPIQPTDDKDDRDGFSEAGASGALDATRGATVALREIAPAAATLRRSPARAPGMDFPAEVIAARLVIWPPTVALRGGVPRAASLRTPRYRRPLGVGVPVVRLTGGSRTTALARGDARPSPAGATTTRRRAVVGVDTPARRRTVDPPVVALARPEVQPDAVVTAGATWARSEGARVRLAPVVRFVPTITLALPDVRARAAELLAKPFEHLKGLVGLLSPLSEEPLAPVLAVRSSKAVAPAPMASSPVRFVGLDVPATPGTAAHPLAILALMDLPLGMAAPTTPWLRALVGLTEPATPYNQAPTTTWLAARDVVPETAAPLMAPYLSLIGLDAPKTPAARKLDRAGQTSVEVAVTLRNVTPEAAAPVTRVPRPLVGLNTPAASTLASTWTVALRSGVDRSITAASDSRVTTLPAAGQPGGIGRPPPMELGALRQFGFRASPAARLGADRADRGEPGPTPESPDPQPYPSLPRWLESRVHAGRRGKRGRLGRSFTGRRRA